jgi:hypothetical protein
MPDPVYWTRILALREEAEGSALDKLLPKPTVCPSTGSGRTVGYWNHVAFPFMLSLTKHKINLGNSPLTRDRLRKMGKLPSRFTESPINPASGEPFVIGTKRRLFKLRKYDK